MQTEHPHNPPLSVLTAPVVPSERHRLSVIGDDDTPPAEVATGWAVSWSLAVGLWIDQNLPLLRSGLTAATVAGWVGIVAWLSFNLFEG